MRPRAKPSKAKIESKRSEAPKSRQSKSSRVHDLEERLVEALEQQTATSEILRVISSSPTDTQPVFETIAATALRLCNAKLCTVFKFDGKLIHLVALHQVSKIGRAHV